MIKAVIFDFDNVIGISERPHFEVLQQSAKKFGVIISDDTFPIKIGKTTRKFFDAILSEKDKQYVDEIVQDYELEFKGHITKYVEPVQITVDFIKNYQGPIQFAIASMSSYRVIEQVIKHFGIYEKFTVIISKEDVIQHKPDPEIYFKTAQKLQVVPSECVVIEDAVVGVVSALSAKMKCYVLLNEFNSKKEFADLSIEGFITSQKDLETVVLQ